MADLLQGIREFFNRRTTAKDIEKGASSERRTLVIENGESAQRLLNNPDFALMFNLYRFYLLTALEDSGDDAERIRNEQYVAGVRDFQVFVERTVYLAKVAQKRAES